MNDACAVFPKPTDARSPHDFIDFFLFHGGRSFKRVASFFIVLGLVFGSSFRF